MSAYVRTQQDTGTEPRLDLIRAALRRLAESDSRIHAEFGTRQLELLGRVSSGRALPAPGTPA